MGLDDTVDYSVIVLNTFYKMTANVYPTQPNTITRYIIQVTNVCVFTHFSLLSLQIFVRFNLLEFRDFDEKQGRICVTGSLMVRWSDDRLVWNPADYGGISKTRFTQSHTWTPPIVLSNAYDAIAMLGFDTASTYIYSNGTIVWYPKQVMEASCDPDVTFFPFDQQKCLLEYTLYGYDMTEMLMVNEHEIKKDEYVTMPNSIWEIISTTAKVVNRLGFEMFHVNIEFQRRSSFYVVGMMFPITLMSILNLFPFCIPPEVGGRIEFSTTIILTIAVFMTTVSDSLPQSSLPQVSLICFMVVGHMILSALILLATILGSRIYTKDENEEITCVWAMLGKCFKTTKITKKNQVRAFCPDVHAVYEHDKEPIKNKDVFTNDTVSVSSPQEMSWNDIGHSYDRFCTYFFVISNIALNVTFTVLMTLSSSEKIG